MTTTLFEAKPYDPKKERRNRLLISGIITFVLIAAFFTWWFRFLPYEHRVDKFFDALEQKNYETAYSIWMNDPNWKQHPQQYSRYPYGEFYTDWGPGGRVGTDQQPSCRWRSSTSRREHWSSGRHHSEPSG